MLSLPKRKGQVLNANSILKADHYPSLSSSYPSLVKSAINFRRAPFDSFHIYGVAMPSRDAIEEMLGYLRANYPNSREILWISLREEPCIYIKGKPFVLRDLNHPFQNLNLYAGISPARVLEMEERLRLDVLQEAESLGNRLVLHDETEESDLEAFWEQITPNDVLTPYGTPLPSLSFSLPLSLFLSLYI